jgi:uncharacterized protein YbjT (DUF2867 family)
MIVVTGATGNVGRPLVAALAAAGHAVTAVARGATAALPRTEGGVVGVRADVTDVRNLEPALAGARALCLIVPGAGSDIDGSTLMHAATDAGVRRVVLLSSQAAGTRSGSISHAPFAMLEEAVRASGLEWTILRPGGFASNANAWAASIREQRTVFAPYADVALPIIDPLDVADVAAVALNEDGHAGRTYELTGPELTTPRDRTKAIAAALGEQLELVELSHEQARQQLLTLMPEPVADGTLEILGQPTPQEQQVSGDVAEVLGRPGYSFADWAARNAAAFR